MNAKYKVKLNNVLFDVNGLKVVLDGGEVVEGSTADVAARIKATKLGIRESKLGGEKVGVFPLFVPSNQRQRDILAAKIGEIVNKDEGFRFSSRLQALGFYHELKHLGVATNAKHWPYGVMKYAPKKVHVIENVPALAE